MGLAVLVFAIVSFAAFITAHALLCYHLAHESPLRAAIALLIFPLTPLWGRAFRKLTLVWLVTFAAYLGAIGATFMVT